MQSIELNLIFRQIKSIHGKLKDEKQLDCISFIDLHCKMIDCHSKRKKKTTTILNMTDTHGCSHFRIMDKINKIVNKVYHISLGI